MARPISNFPYQQSMATSSAHGVIDFLRTHDRMATLFPSLARMAELQRDCSALLPPTFDSCTIVQFESGCLVLSTPNAALAAKLKQRLPKLQEALQKRGWQVSSIRIKVQVEPPQRKPATAPAKDKHLPKEALSAFSELEGQLENSIRNAALKEAIQTLIQRHHNKDGQ